MARQLRLEFEGALYHVTARGNEQRDIFLDDTDRETFVSLLGKEIQQQGWLCYAYCLMGNHYHLLLETPEPNLSRGMRRLNGVYTQKFNWRHERKGHLFQGRYKSILIEKENYLLELCRYIVLNPVRSGMVADEGHWLWSSYRATAGLDLAPEWLQVSGIWGLFGQSDKGAANGYRQFVSEGVGRSSPWADIRGQIYLGGESFLVEMAGRASGRPLDNVPVAQREPNRIDKRSVLECVSQVYRLDQAKVISRGNSEAYGCAAYLLRRVVNMTLREVAALFGVSVSRISHIQRRIETKQLSGQELETMRLCKVKQ
jgi:putative transposase